MNAKKTAALYPNWKIDVPETGLGWPCPFNRPIIALSSALTILLLALDQKETNCQVKRRILRQRSLFSGFLSKIPSNLPPAQRRIELCGSATRAPLRPKFEPLAKQPRLPSRGFIFSASWPRLLKLCPMR